MINLSDSINLLSNSAENSGATAGTTGISTNSATGGGRKPRNLSSDDTIEVESDNPNSGAVNQRQQ
jgi:hypothetical protein